MFILFVEIGAVMPRWFKAILNIPTFEYAILKFPYYVVVFEPKLTHFEATLVNFETPFKPV